MDRIPLPVASDTRRFAIQKAIDFHQSLAVEIKTAEELVAFAKVIERYLDGVES